MQKSNNYWFWQPYCIIVIAKVLFLLRLQTTKVSEMPRNKQNILNYYFLSQNVQLRDV